MQQIFLLFAAIFLGLVLSACIEKGESGLQGRLMQGDEPLAGATVEIYLKAEKDRSTLPFATTSTDEEGRFRIALPNGRYFIIGKKKLLVDGRSRMLMAECPANPIEVVGKMRTVASFPLREMGREGELVPEPETGLVGRLVHADKPVSNGYVYIYTEPVSGMMGPSYGEAIRTDHDGYFQADLPAGEFYLAARKRADGERMGEPEAGDLNGTYAGNPITVTTGHYFDIGDMKLEKVDAGKRQLRLAGGKFDATGTRLAGQVVNRDGRPVAGIYVFAYLDRRMVGKPTYISAPTGRDGRYALNLGDGGTYYLGARSTYGGPLEPGEWVGTFDEQADHSVEIERGRTRQLADIVVREVW